MAKPVKTPLRKTRLTVDFGPDMDGLKAAAKRLASATETPVKPTHIVRLAVKRYLQETAA
jgi:hypothetical protein